MVIITKNVEETHTLAAALAGACETGDCILLCGDLGAGKTEFARGFIRASQVDAEEVVSPTFTLAQSYPARGGKTIWHFDLYRLKHSAEIAELGMEDALSSGVTLIEWPELAKELLPESALRIDIAHGVNPQERRFSLSGAAWEKRLEEIRPASNRCEKIYG